VKVSCSERAAIVRRIDGDFLAAEVTTIEETRALDADAFTRATDHNQRFWELGDTFEIFLRPPGQAAYVELHVAPGNLRLHLRFADAAWMTRDPFVDPFGTSLASAELFRSRVWMPSDSARWCVLARIPAGSVCAVPTPLPGSTWAFSFSRYDYTRGADEPVLSSTSPHAIAAFHRQHEWGAVRFADAPASVGQRRRDASFGS